MFKSPFNLIQSMLVNRASHSRVFHGLCMPTLIGFAHRIHLAVLVDQLLVRELKLLFRLRNLVH